MKKIAAFILLSVAASSGFSPRVTAADVAQLTKDSQRSGEEFPGDYDFNPYTAENFSSN